MSIIAVSNHKGGVGKTTSTINIGAGMVNEGNRVLLVDLDAQANLTQSLGIKEPKRTIYEGLKEGKPVEPVTVRQGLDVIPSTLDLSGVEMELAGVAGREFILKEILQEQHEEYDFILIDTPPSLGILTVNSFVVSRYILIPLQPEYLALRGLTKLVEVHEVVQERLNKDIEILGVFLTRYDDRKILNRDVKQGIEKMFKGKVLETSIRDNIAVAEAPTAGVDIFAYDKDCNGAKDYKELTRELLNKLNN